MNSNQNETMAVAMSRSDYQIAMAAGRDAGDRSMRVAGRENWNEEDYSRAAETVARLLPEGAAIVDGAPPILAMGGGAAIETESTEVDGETETESTQAGAEYGMEGTYSPEDNKLRIRAAARLPRELYERVKAAGFAWAPKQGLFVAPAWSPSREDFVIELCGELGDEDTTLVDRAEQRADRFEGYRGNRLRDAHQARATVERIADGIPFGQPILVGHHSERHARRDAARIENGMRKAVQMWDTAEYWKHRAAGALRHAKYKELPAVRARRIKGLESELRKTEKSKAEFLRAGEMWAKVAAIQDPEQQREAAIKLAGTGGPCCNFRMPRKEGDKEGWTFSCDAYAALTNHHPTIYAPRTLAEVIAQAVKPWTTQSTDRWIAHYQNRLAYERAMLAEGGGLEAEKFDLKPGGRVNRKRDGNWYVITKLNRKAGAVVSVSVVGHWSATIQIEDIADYQAPKDGDAEKVAKAIKPLPLVNWRAPGCIEMTSDEWKDKSRYSDSYAVRRFTAEHKAEWRGPAAYRQRAISHWKDGVKPVFLTDAKVTNPPEQPRELVKLDPRPELEAVAIENETERLRRANEAREEAKAQAAPFDALKDALRTGQAVQVVSAPQLFPTPKPLAARVVEVAKIEPGMCVLEPSAGTGALIRPIVDSVDTEILAYEVNSALCGNLRQAFPPYRVKVICKDFLEVDDFQGCYPRIVMNPPFENGADIRHIEHARRFLAPGGRLVAICANGPRQRATLKPIAESTGGWWEDLPAGSFAESGTMVNAALLVIEG